MAYVAMHVGGGERRELAVRDYGCWADRLRYLDEPERTVLELWLRHHASCRQIARMTRMNAGVIHRRVAYFSRRCREPVVTMLCDPGAPFSRQVRRIGLLRYLLGHAKASIVRQLDLPYSQITQALQEIDRTLLVIGQRPPLPIRRRWRA